MTEMKLFSIELAESKKCEAFGPAGHPHVYHCSPVLTNPWRPPQTHRYLCPYIRLALINLGLSPARIEERYGKDIR